MHFSRGLTMLGEALYEDSPMSLAGLMAANDERLARGYETAMLQYHTDRAEYLDGLAPEQRAAEAERLPCIDETMRKRLYGVGASDHALAG